MTRAAGSLKGRLFAILVLSTGLVWASATVWIFLSTRAEVEHVLDARLMEAARMVSSLVDSQEIDVAVASLDRPELPARTHDPYERQLSCQIWSLTGSLIGKSDGAPDVRLSEQANGFSERTIDGAVWRVYAIQDATLGIQVLIGDNLAVRARLVRDVVKGLLLPIILIVPALGALIWFGVGRGMRPLDDLAAGLGRRDAQDLAPLAADGVASEIKPVVAALNGLFGRVRETRERERHFLAYAAHELRTPLAGLRTQAEIVARTDSEEVRKAALARIVTAVDRTSRLVRQLLDTAEAESESFRVSGDGPPIDLKKFLVENAADLAASARSRGVTIVFSAAGKDARLCVNETLLALAYRNLLENAVNHSPPGGSVRVGWSSDHLFVDDEGEGMPEEEQERAAERFFRGANKSAVGSGLGLTIVSICAARLGAALAIENLVPRGFRASLKFPGPCQPS
ncbi:ATP-binding protein [Aureimonas glaciei]|uniref:histidine kinase n=1 Tax=Aureimonas glaciei TaxID=1776957 RepID=A0A916XXL4_9HYPH|nr:ATP-binding protein [Aureimonas glaciei]GGD17711.1 two-component sensor histidine kinase [Aureimonas glaciei]